MRWCRYDTTRYGLVHQGNVYDATEEVKRATGTRERGWGDAFVRALPVLHHRVDAILSAAPIGPSDRLSFDSPVRYPTKIIGAPVNYRSHVAEASADAALNVGRPVVGIRESGLFLKAATCLVGEAEGVALRFPDRRSDHEVEVAVVIADECSDLRQDEAMEHVAGYSLALDITVRGPEDRSFRKSLDTYGVLGPYLITPDEIARPDDLAFGLSVNCAVKQAATTRSMIVSVPELVSWASHWYTLYPGDVIMTGTPHGVSQLHVGDVLHCWLEDLASMTVQVRAHNHLAGGRRRRESAEWQATS
jgi:2-keto-4-pentenoate hydratase/2-oxohepta-3-ene-1,7-dioic acid hydratase in catechol pathway